MKWVAATCTCNLAALLSLVLRGFALAFFNSYVNALRHQFDRTRSRRETGGIVERLVVRTPSGS